MIFRYKTIGYIMPQKFSGLVDSKFVFGTKLNKKAYLVEGLPHVTRTLLK